MVNSKKKLFNERKWWLDFSISHYFFFFNFIVFLIILPIAAIKKNWTIDTIKTDPSFYCFLVILIVFFLSLCNEIRILVLLLKYKKTQIIPIQDKTFKYFFNFMFSWKKVEKIGYQDFLAKKEEYYANNNNDLKSVKNAEELLDYKNELIKKYQDLISEHHHDDSIITQQLFHYTQKINAINIKPESVDFSNKTELLNKYKKILNVYEDILDKEKEEEEILGQKFDGVLNTLKKTNTFKPITESLIGDQANNKEEKVIESEEEI